MSDMQITALEVSSKLLHEFNKALGVAPKNTRRQILLLQEVAQQISLADPEWELKLRSLLFATTKLRIPGCTRQALDESISLLLKGQEFTLVTQAETLLLLDFCLVASSLVQ